MTVVDSLHCNGSLTAMTREAPPLGIELAASRLEVEHSLQLSYRGERDS